MPANVLIEEQGVNDLVGKFAVATDGNVNIQTDIADPPRGTGTGLGVPYLLPGISLILKKYTRWSRPGLTAE